MVAYAVKRTATYQLVDGCNDSKVFIYYWRELQEGTHAYHPSS